MHQFHIFVINLKHRTDRLENVTNEFRRLNLDFERFNAFQHEFGALGCTLSHIACIKKAKKNNYEYCMVCEDDAEFCIDRNELDKFISEFIEDNNLKILVIIGHIYNKSNKKSYNDLFYTSNDIQTTTCYLVKNSYYDKLIENFEYSKKNLILSKNVSNFAIDVTWKELQKKDCWVIPKKNCGKQTASYSDIEKKYVMYDANFNHNTRCFISIDICGGLGNQLFQIACVYSLCYKYNTEPIFLKLESSPSIFKNRPVYFDNLLKKIKICDAKYYENLSFIPIKENNASYKEIILDNLFVSYKLSGYYQSPKYFNNYRDKIIDLFSLDDIYNERIGKIYKNIKNNFNETVSLHVRRGDYLKLSHFHTNIVKKYYDEAMNYFSDSILCVIFSDDIEWCKANFNYKNMFFVENIYLDSLPNDVIELKLMNLCDNNIIANSSFSWWGAWLNTNINKKVIAPKRWFEDDVKNDEIKDIYDTEWIII
jgi:hypothetical protein